MASLRFSLRTMWIYFAAFSALSGILAAADVHSTFGIVAIGLAVRVLTVLSVGLSIGALVGDVRSATLAALAGVVFADLIFVGIIRGVFGWNYATLFAANPIAAVAAFSCPAACARSQTQALLSGLVLSISLSIATGIAILWIAISRDPEWGYLFYIVAFWTSFVAVFTGFFATLFVRMFLERIDPTLRPVRSHTELA